MPTTAPIRVEVLVEDQTAALRTLDPTEAAVLNSIPWEEWIGTWMNQLQPDLSPIQAYEMSLRLTGDAGIQTLNAQYRHQDRPTDVLSFAALEFEGPMPIELSQLAPLYLGDIIISVETAQRQADQQNHSLKRELAWLTAHGLLHLLGWDHPDETRLTEMLSQQDHLLAAVLI